MVDSQSKSATSSRKISHAGARQKGLSFEREVAKMFRAVFPKAERQLEFQQSQANGTDLRNTEPFKVQCKRNRDYASISKIEEVIRQHASDVPLLITKGDNKKAIAVMYLEDFLLMLENNKDVIKKWKDTWESFDKVDDLI